MKAGFGALGPPAGVFVEPKPILGPTPGGELKFVEEKPMLGPGPPGLVDPEPIELEPAGGFEEPDTPGTWFIEAGFELPGFDEEPAGGTGCP